MRDTTDNLLYIGNKVYQKTTLLLDVEVIEALQKNKDTLTPAETVNKILREALLDDN